MYSKKKLASFVAIGAMSMSLGGTFIPYSQQILPSVTAKADSYDKAHLSQNKKIVKNGIPKLKVIINKGGAGSLVKSAYKDAKGINSKSSASRYEAVAGEVTMALSYYTSSGNLKKQSVNKDKTDDKTIVKNSTGKSNPVKSTKKQSAKATADAGYTPNSHKKKVSSDYEKDSDSNKSKSGKDSNKSKAKHSSAKSGKSKNKSDDKSEGSSIKSAKKNDSSKAKSKDKQNKKNESSAKKAVDQKNKGKHEVSASSYSDNPNNKKNKNSSSSVKNSGDKTVTPKKSYDWVYKTVGVVAIIGVLIYAFRDKLKEFFNK